MGTLQEVDVIDLGKDDATFLLESIDGEPKTNERFLAAARKYKAEQKNDIIEHCMVDGKRCSKCCEVVLLNKYSYSYAWLEYARKIRKGEVSDKNMEYVRSCFSGESLQILLMLRPIKKRKAKKLNPHVFANKDWIQNSIFFTCEHLTDGGCGDYANRPNMCSKYPYYGDTPEEFKGKMLKSKDLGYSDDCTFYIDIK